MAAIPEEAKGRIEDLIRNLEVATGEILFRDKDLMPIVAAMRQHLNGLRALLGLEKPH
jgi:hypothetical protein